MCGIFGVINFDGQPVDKDRVLSARDILAHRGPDDSGIYYSTCHLGFFDKLRKSSGEGSLSVALAHRRLSIIDLSPAAHQPMISDDGRFTIVFNGEIYNFEELKEEVGSRQSAVGNKFKTNSDTEVILNLFDEYGAECLKYLRGMFAFAIWDDREKKLFAARDRFGIKPFYYLHNSNEFIFSSELKAIKHYKKVLTLSIEGMDAYLRTGSVPAPLTIYEETKALMPGHWLTIINEKLEIKNYWSFFDLIGHPRLDPGFNFSGLKEQLHSTPNSKMDSRFHGNDPSTGLRMSHKYDGEAKKIIRDALLDSIKAHLVSDVEVGAFLSGGIDSTAIVSLMKQSGHDKIKTLSVTFPGNKLDESKYSNLAAKKYETDHFEYKLQEKELLDDFEKIIEAMDQPTIDGVNTYFVSKAAASFGLKVVLSGLGGDELFGGYPSFINIPKYRRVKSLPFAKQLMKAAGLVLNGRLPVKAIEYLKNPDAPNAEYRLIRGLFTDAELQALGWQPRSQQSAVNGQWQNPKQPMTNYSMTNDLLTNDPITNDQFTNALLTNLQYISMLESCFYMRNQLLRDSDVFSMTHSLELRVPFVDHLLYGAVLPYLDGGFDRSFPKKILVEGTQDLPDEIVHRPKQGFTFPFADWMIHGKIKEVITDSLMSSKLLFDKKVSGNLINKFESGKLHWSRIWALFIANKFNE